MAASQELKIMHLTVHPRDNRRKNKRSWRDKFVAAGSLLAFVGAIGALYGWRSDIKSAVGVGRQFIFENRYFSVREIQLHAGVKVGGKEIIALAGLRQGMNIWKIEPTVIEARIAKHPWVRRVVVRRDFPHRIIIDVEERQPKAIVAIGRLYYVDSDGVLFKEVGTGENVQFPMLTGLRPEELASSDTRVRRRIQDALRVGDLIIQDSHALSEIHFDAPDRLVLYTMAHPVALRMGWGDWEAKRQRLNRVLGLWKGKEERLASLDVSFRDQVVTRLRRTSQ
jgi:cell division protein FtsQ